MPQDAWTSNILTTEYEPFVGPTGEVAGEVAWLRQTGSEGSTLLAGMWRCQPTSFDYPFLEDESFVITAGKLLIEFPDGATWELGEGETASFAKGAKSRWTVVEPVTKFFIVSGA